MKPHKGTGNTIDIAAPWIQVAALPGSGCVLSLDDAGDIPLTGLFTIVAPRSGLWRKLRTTVGVVLLIGEPQDRGRVPAGESVINLNAAGQLLYTPQNAILLDASALNVAFNANDNKFSAWNDFAGLVSMSLCGQVPIGQTNTAQVFIQGSADGVTLDQDGGAGFAMGSQAQDGVPTAAMTANRIRSNSRFHRIRIQMGAIGGVHTVRLAWTGHRS